MKSPRCVPRESVSFQLGVSGVRKEETYDSNKIKKGGESVKIKANSLSDLHHGPTFLTNP